MLCPREGGCVARARTFEIDFDLLARRAAPGGSRPRTSEKRGGGGAAASASASAPTVAIDQPAASHRHVHGQRDMWVWHLPHRQSGAGRAGRQAVLCPLPRGSQPVPHPESGEARTAPRRSSRGGFSCGRMRWASIRSSVHPAKSGSRCCCCCSSNFLLLFGAPHRKSTCKYVDNYSSVSKLKA